MLGRELFFKKTIADDTKRDRYALKRKRAAKRWGRLSKDAKGRWISEANVVAEPKPAAEPEEPVLQCHGVLCTWIHKSWVDQATKEFVLRNVPAGPLTLDGVCETLVRNPRVRQMREDFVAFHKWRMETACAKFPEQKMLVKNHRWSHRLELCPIAFEKKILLLHWHEYTSSDVEKIIVDFKGWRFGGVRPQAVPCTARAAGRPRALCQGHYYGGSAPKVGTLYQATNFEAHKQFAVNPLWPRALWTCNKMTAAMYRSETIKCKIDLDKHLKNAEKHDRVLEEEGLREMRAEVMLMVRRRYKRLRRYAKVDNEYLPHFLEAKGRYPTLVVVGPSGGGKTEWGMRFLCESPDGPECMYHSDCANCMVPPLAGWEYNGYKGIV